MVSAASAPASIPRMDARGKTVNGALLVCGASTFAAETLFIAGTSLGSAIRNEESPFLETSRDGNIYRIRSSVSDNTADSNELICWIIMLIVRFGFDRKEYKEKTSKPLRF